MSNATPVKAIRKFCLTCAQGSYKIIRECQNLECPLRLFRMGHNPKRAQIGGNLDTLKQNMKIDTFAGDAKKKTDSSRLFLARKGIVFPDASCILPSGEKVA